MWSQSGSLILDSLHSEAYPVRGLWETLGFTLDCHWPLTYRACAEEVLLGQSQDSGKHMVSSEPQS